MPRIHSLGYLGFSSPRAKEWRRFGPVFGLEVEDGPGGSIHLRWDERPYRLRLEPGPDDRLAFLGWEAPHAAAFGQIVQELQASGVEVVTDDADLVRDRMVSALAHFYDPFGIRHELFYGPMSYDRSFQGTRATTAFKTGPQGLGHAVIAVPDMSVAISFYEGVLGLRTTDIVNLDGGGMMRFLRCNTRHHSIALWETREPVLGLQHLMIEARDLNEVGKVYDLIQASEWDLSSTMGRHAGDEQLSFYTRTPSGFDLELGCDSIDIDEDIWSARYFDKTAGSPNEVWGHQWKRLGPQSSLHAVR